MTKSVSLNEIYKSKCKDNFAKTPADIMRNIFIKYGRGKSIEAFGELCGISPRTMHNYMNYTYNRQADLANILQIVIYYELNPNDALELMSAFKCIDANGTGDYNELCTIIEWNYYNCKDRAIDKRIEQINYFIDERKRKIKLKL